MLRHLINRHFVIIIIMILLLCEYCRTYLSVVRVVWSARCAVVLNVLASATKDTTASMYSCITFLVF